MVQSPSLGRLRKTNSIHLATISPNRSLSTEPSEITEWHTSIRVGTTVLACLPFARDVPHLGEVISFSSPEKLPTTFERSKPYEIRFFHHNSSRRVTSRFSIFELKKPYPLPSPKPIERAEAHNGMSNAEACSLECGKYVLAKTELRNQDVFLPAIVQNSSSDSNKPNTEARLTVQFRQA